MDLGKIVVSEVRQSKTNTVCFHLYVEWNKNKGQDEYNKTDRYTQQTSRYQWEEG